MEAAARQENGARSVRQSLQEYGRGIIGGLVFSLPLLYTMEMWWAGFITRPERLLAYVLVIFVLLLAYNRYAGLRQNASWTEVAIDSVEEMGIGLIVSAVFLWLLGRLTADMTAGESMGKIILEAKTVTLGLPAAIGASLGRLLLK